MPEADTVQTTIRIPKDLHQRLRIRSVKTGESLTAIIERVLRAELTRKPRGVEGDDA